MSETKGEKGWQWDGEESRHDRRKEESKKGLGDESVIAWGFLFDM